MEGAFAAMGSGQVDENWAREHHALWIEELDYDTQVDPDAPPVVGAGVKA